MALNETIRLISIKGGIGSNSTSKGTAILNSYPAAVDMFGVMMLTALVVHILLALGSMLYLG
jgi:hypothetical protein